MKHKDRIVIKGHGPVKKKQKPEKTAKVVLRLRLPVILVTNVVYLGESDRVPSTVFTWPFKKFLFLIGG